MCLVTSEEQKSYSFKVQINSHMFRGKNLWQKHEPAFVYFTQWHYSLFKTKIYLPRKCLYNSSFISGRSHGHHLACTKQKSQDIHPTFTGHISLPALTLWGFYSASNYCTLLLFALTASTLRIKLLAVHWTFSHITSLRGSPLLPGFISRHFVVFGPWNDLVIQTEHVSFDPMWLVTQHSLLIHLSKSGNSSSAHRYLLRHYWLTDTYM